MGFSKQKYWNGLPFPSPGDLPNPGIDSVSPALQADSLTPEISGKQPRHTTNILKVSLMTVNFGMSWVSLWCPQKVVRICLLMALLYLKQ